MEQRLPYVVYTLTITYVKDADIWVFFRQKVASYGQCIENQTGYSNGNLQPVIDPERDG